MSQETQNTSKFYCKGYGPEWDILEEILTQEEIDFYEEEGYKFHTIDPVNIDGE